MKLTSISILVLGSVLATGLAHASVSDGSSHGILSGKEKCASALNSYLNYNNESSSEDDNKIDKLEKQVDALCNGYQVNLIEDNGVTTGVVELAR